MLTDDCRSELVNRIIPFWSALCDREHGGFYGRVENDLTVDRTADKGVILNSRILWFFSNCFLVLGDRKCLDMAAHAYRFLRDCCYDGEYGGVYWMMRYDGTPSDTLKHSYNLAFAIYGLSSYFDASGDKEALDLAMTLFGTVEERAADEYGYKEAFTREWQPAENGELSENGIAAERTMNTLLHLNEAYTELYRVSGNGRVAERMRRQLEIIDEKIIDHENSRLRVFFDDRMNVLGDIHSYGHDIEYTWLADRACRILGDRELIERFGKSGLKIAESIYGTAFENGALNNERDGEKIDKKRVWWVQAEAVVGFLNAYEKSGDEKFLEAAREILRYIGEYITDKREGGGEWFGEIDFETNTPLGRVRMVDAWKCPYHNGRMCLEILTRRID